MSEKTKLPIELPDGWSTEIQYGAVVITSCGPTGSPQGYATVYENERRFTIGYSLLFAFGRSSISYRRSLSPYKGRGWGQRLYSDAVAALQSHNSEYEEFKAMVSAARPDIEYTFDRGPDFQAKWTFPGAQFGGSVMWAHGTKILGYGIAQCDLEAWREHELKNGREPRWN